jgi:hypothetical protein
VTTVIAAPAEKWIQYDGTNSEEIRQLAEDNQIGDIITATIVSEVDGVLTIDNYVIPEDRHYETVLAETDWLGSIPAGPLPDSEFQARYVYRTI